MTAMLAVPADMHIKAYAILPSDAAIILGLSRISWPKSYPKESALPCRPFTRSTYNHESAVQHDTCREGIQHTRNGKHRRRLTVQVRSGSHASSDAYRSTNDMDQLARWDTGTSDSRRQRIRHPGDIRDPPPPALQLQRTQPTSQSEPLEQLMEHERNEERHKFIADAECQTDDD